MAAVEDLNRRITQMQTLMHEQYVKLEFLNVAFNKKAKAEIIKMADAKNTDPGTW